MNHAHATAQAVEIENIRQSAYTDVKVVSLLEQIVMGLANVADEIANLNQTLTRLRK